MWLLDWWAFVFPDKCLFFPNPQMSPLGEKFALLAHFFFTTQEVGAKNLRHAKHPCVCDWLQITHSSKLHSKIETMEVAMAYKKQQQQL